MQIVAHDCPRCGAPTQGPECSWCERLKKKAEQGVKRDIEHAEQFGRAVAEKMESDAKRGGYA